MSSSSGMSPEGQQVAHLVDGDATPGGEQDAGSELDQQAQPGVDMADVVELRRATNTRQAIAIIGQV